MTLVPTTIEQLKQIRLTEVISLPPFPDGTPLNAEVKHPDVSDMALSGKIPNRLIELIPEIAQEAKEADGKGVELAENDLSQIRDFMDTLCQICLVSPTYSDIKEYAGGLTFDQKLAVFHWAVGGVNEIADTFRNERNGNDADTGNVQTVREMPV